MCVVGIVEKSWVEMTGVVGVVVMGWVVMVEEVVVVQMSGNEVGVGDVVVERSWVDGVERVGVGIVR